MADCSGPFAGKDLFFTVEDVKYEDLAEMETSDKLESLGQPGKLRYCQFKQKTGKVVKVNDRQIALFKYKGKIFAMDEKCPHLGGPLHLGDIESVGEAQVACVRCPWHSWKIALGTGEVMRPQKRNARINVYPVRVDKQGNISVGFESMSCDFFNGGTEF